jgi:tRNA isopentenyl-2-thiomethyl-A-37 hydroxylase MiaE
VKWVVAMNDSCASRGEVRRYWTPADAARAAEVTPAAIKAAADGGRLRIAARTERGIRLFDPLDVAAFIERRAEQGRP